jgi:holo-[acyl-carrier protein] synthase
MIGISSGVDLLQIDRLINLDAAIKQRFLARVFTTREIEQCNGRYASLAGFFCAKEAAVKALGCGIGEVGWQDIEISKDEQGQPQLLLHGGANTKADQAGWFSWSVSISHTADYAVATVCALYERE